MQALITTRHATKLDIPGIIQLQTANLFEKLSHAQREQGFVTTPFTVSQLQTLIDRQGLFVGEHNGAIKGYTMAAAWDYFQQWAIFPYMLQRLSGTVFNNIIISEHNSFQYGPICIDHDLRGSDAFPRLFETMRIAMSAAFQVGITFINSANARSYSAHLSKLQMTVVDQFEFNGRNYYSLAFDPDRSVM